MHLTRSVALLAPVLALTVGCPGTPPASAPPVSAPSGSPQTLASPALPTTIVAIRDGDPGLGIGVAVAADNADAAWLAALMHERLKGSAFDSPTVTPGAFGYRIRLRGASASAVRELARAMQAKVTNAEAEAASEPALALVRQALSAPRIILAT